MVGFGAVVDFSAFRLGLLESFSDSLTWFSTHKLLVLGCPCRSIGLEIVDYANALQLLKAEGDTVGKTSFHNSQEISDANMSANMLN